MVYDKQSDLIKILENRFATRVYYKPRNYKDSLNLGSSEEDDKTEKTRFKVQATVMMIGFFLITIGISTVFIGPIFSDFKAAFPGNKTNSSPQIIPAETSSNDRPAWYAILVLVIGIVFSILGVLLIPRLIQEKAEKVPDSLDTQ
jgi:uncharacterized membrane protein